jgi:hypothetical protein
MISTVKVLNGEPTRIKSANEFMSKQWTSEQEAEFRCLAAREATGMLQNMASYIRYGELSNARRECLGDVPETYLLPPAIGAALADVAKAIREHTEAMKESQREKWRRAKRAQREKGAP